MQGHAHPSILLREGALEGVHVGVHQDRNSPHPLQCDKDQQIPSTPGAQASPETSYTRGTWHGAEWGRQSREGGPEHFILHTDPKRQARGPRGAPCCLARRNPTMLPTAVPRARPVTQDTGSPANGAILRTHHCLIKMGHRAVRGKGNNRPQSISPSWPGGAGWPFREAGPGR